MVTAYTDGQVTLRSKRRRDGYHEALDMSGHQGVERGDLVVHGLDILRGSVGISDTRGAISSVCIVCSPKVRCDARYFAYVIRAQAFTGLPRALARGVREGGADFRRWDTLADLPLPLPPVATQKSIADNLDRETTRIHALLTAKQRMVGLLDARLRSVISEATATGPEVKVRRVTSLRTSGPRGWGDLVTETGKPFIRSANLQREDIELRTDNLVSVQPPLAAESERSSTRPGDVLVGITGANTGWTGLVRPDQASGYVSQHVALLRPRGVNPEWLALSVFSDRSQEQLLGGQYGGTKQQLGLDDLAELRIHVPSIEDQTRIVSRLQIIKQRTKTACAAIHRQIDLLQERRQSLITAAVTGQIDISEAA